MAATAAWPAQAAGGGVEIGGLGRAHLHVAAPRRRRRLRRNGSLHVQEGVLSRVVTLVLSLYLATAEETKQGRRTEREKVIASLRVMSLLQEHHHSVNYFTNNEVQWEDVCCTTRL